MKTLELKLKKDVLIVDVDESFNHFKIYDDEIGFIFTENNIPRKELIKGSYKFLCKGSVLTEEISSELVEEHYMNGIRSYEIYNDYKYNDSRWLDEALDSFKSAIESKGFYWLENNLPPYIPVIDKKADENYIKKYFEAEEKTFSNPLIFVKK